LKAAVILAAGNIVFYYYDNRPSRYGDLDRSPSIPATMSKSLAKFHVHSYANLLLNLLIVGVAGYLLVTDISATLLQ